MDVLHPRVFEAAVGKALEILTQERGERRTKVEAELTKTQLRIDRLVGALADATLPADDIKPAAQRGEIEAAPLLMWK